MDAPRLKKLASRRINRRLKIEAILDGLSTTIPEDISNEKERETVQKTIEEYYKEFQKVNDQLLNNVRVNLQKQLKPIFDSFKSLIAISDLDQSTISEKQDEVERQIGALESRMEASKNQAIRLMRTIVQQCNDIINSLRT